MSDTPQTINGELLRLKRESMGWLVGDLATRACMSTKQIRQLEEGGSSSFYSESVKLTSAKKVGGILGLTPDEVFGVVPQNPVNPSDEDPFQTVEVPATDPVADIEVPFLAAQTSSASNPTDVADATPIQAESLAPFKPSNDVADAPVQSVAAPVTEQKNKTPLGAIAALFVAALAVAEWMRPEAEPVAVEPPPPLQTLPAETPDGAASAASAEAAGVPASAASVASPAVTLAQPQASAAPAAPKASAAPLAPSAPTASASASKPL
jgi:transcriptional regulator with XRE-family HTH domain